LTYNKGNSKGIIMNNQEEYYTEPCGTHNQITKEFFGALAELDNKRRRVLTRNNGSHYYQTYHYLRY
jgi:hypothetical protein